MNAFPDLITTAENRYAARKDARDEAIECAEIGLRLDFMSAAIKNPLLPIPTPAYSRQRETQMAEVFGEELIGPNELLECVEALKESQKGMALLRKIAGKYAECHAIAMVEE